jgi:hypothetical protein
MFLNILIIIAALFKILRGVFVSGAIGGDSFSWDKVDLESIKDMVINDKTKMDLLRKTLGKNGWEALEIERMELTEHKSAYKTYNETTSRRIF